MHQLKMKLMIFFLSGGLVVLFSHLLKQGMFSVINLKMIYTLDCWVLNLVFLDLRNT